jgi:hypothetical protein
MTQPYAPPSATPAYQPPQQQAGTNTLAIIAIIGGFVFPLAGIVCGFIALSQIKRTGQGGRGLALAGVIIGFAIIAFGILMSVVFTMIGLAAAASGH